MVLDVYDTFNCEVHEKDSADNAVISKPTMSILDQYKHLPLWNVVDEELQEGYFEVPSSCSSIQDFTFSHLVKLEILDMSKCSLIKNLGRISPYCPKLRKVILPPNCESLCETFIGCRQLQEVVGLSRVKSIGTDSFADCQSLKFADLSACEYVGFNAFANCIQLKEVVFGCIPSLVLNSHAFLMCRTLKNVHIPKKCKVSLGQEVFAYCSNLETISAQFPEFLDDNTFIGCYKLHRIDTDCKYGISSFNIKNLPYELWEKQKQKIGETKNGKNISSSKN